MDSGDKSEKFSVTSALVEGCSTTAGDLSVKHIFTSALVVGWGCSTPSGDQSLIFLPVRLLKSAVHRLVTRQ
jgi:hypothetical protein